MSDSESECDLPDHIGLVSENEEEEVELPGHDNSDSDESLPVLPGACCSKNCCSLSSAMFFGYNTSAITEETDVAGGQAHTEKVYNMVVQAIKEKPPKFMCGDIPMCRADFTKACGLKPGTMKRLIKHAKDGNQTAPFDGRQLVRTRPRLIDPARINVQNFLWWAYTSLAEYLPDKPDKSGGQSPKKKTEPKTKAPTNPGPKTPHYPKKNATQQKPLPNKTRYPKKTGPKQTHYPTKTGPTKIRSQKKKGAK